MWSAFIITSFTSDSSPNRTGCLSMCDKPNQPVRSTARRKHLRRVGFRFSNGKRISRVGFWFSHAGKAISCVGFHFSRTGKAISYEGFCFSYTGKVISCEGFHFSHTGKAISCVGFHFSRMGKAISTRDFAFPVRGKRFPARLRLCVDTWMMLGERRIVFSVWITIRLTACILGPRTMD